MCSVLSLSCHWLQVDGDGWNSRWFHKWGPGRVMRRRLWGLVVGWGWICTSLQRFNFKFFSCEIFFELRLLLAPKGFPSSTPKLSTVSMTCQSPGSQATLEWAPTAYLLVQAPLALGNNKTLTRSTRHSQKVRWSLCDLAQYKGIDVYILAESLKDIVAKHKQVRKATHA